ncbi:hypothetical protein [Haloferula sargassicola]|uniref:RcnB family protein n=1 Tax=Haloferula sargassicola TaxID=490096 RepID=A0ABP9ULC2_9BACT
MKTTAFRFGLAALAAGSLVVLPSEAKPGKGNKDKGGGPPAAAKGRPGNSKKSHGHGAQAHGKTGPDKSAGHKARPSQVVAGKDRKPAAAAPVGRHNGQDHRFTDAQRQSIRHYFSNYRDRDGGLPPGIAKRLRHGKPLPPGWRDKLQPGHVLDGIWLGSLVPIEANLIPGVPYTDHTRLYLYGDRLIRVYEPRHEIIEVVTVPTIVIDL